MSIDTTGTLDVGFRLDTNTGQMAVVIQATHDDGTEVILVMDPETARDIADDLNATADDVEENNK